MSLEAAVAKMTALPAQILGISDRGVLESGAAADVIVFEPERVHARATYTDPKQLAEGFDMVIVNGRIARRDGTLTSERAGQVLKPAGSR